jgi:hypothetical protein
LEGKGVRDGVRVAAAGTVALGWEVAEGSVVEVGGTVGGTLVAEGVSVGNSGMIVTPGTGVRVGTLGTHNLCPA